MAGDRGVAVIVGQLEVRWIGSAPSRKTNERLICRMVALAAPSEARDLLFVAWRVKEWVEPLLYRSIVIDSSTHFLSRAAPILKLSPHAFDKLVERKSPSFFASYVHDLLFYFVSSEDIGRILRVCLATKNLLIHPTAPRGAVDSLEQLQRLKASFIPDSGCSFFRLNATRSSLRCTPCRALYAFLVIQYFGGPLEINVEPPLKSSNPGFVFIQAVPSPPSRQYFSWMVNWSDGILDRNDFWACADEHIRKRHAREVDR
ncbi:hypothetical protein C8F01DRAFT_1075318 [Mycena amicta]|nr:hypothetical protein C8F01DRAFT_1075318 [Mycena amicta]